ncbi:MAG: hypothetical protein RQ753_04170 [Desulfurivibrionaceae bacterium]|nr:hypothetical protein [Desulfobulbales bacterium]MDT8334871.1 hypothetical protein [Desulfurivibrionaceae bacterium]
MGIFFAGRLRNIIIGIMIGLLLGLWAGYNLGKGKPVFSNPLARETIQNRIKKTGDQAMEKSGKILEESGKAMRDAVSGR